MEQMEAILHYWFGNAEKTALPSEHRTWVWFSGDSSLDVEIKMKFQDDLQKAMDGGYDHWKQTPRGFLALIILFDQFSRHIFRHTPKAFEQDSKALQLCLQGVEFSYDHQLSLIERLFFYFPLMHAENPDMQALSVRAYQILTAIAFSETRPLFQKFLDYAISHSEQIARFSRFPHRNEILGRPSTDAELTFLKTASATFLD
jgi:uncharacterized protein (DUF924 family)